MSDQPWQIPNSPWKDEKAYLNWLRGSIRRIWSRHPVRIAYKQSLRYKAPVGRNGKEVWVCNCEVCGKQSRETQTDHIHGGFGFTDWESFTRWAKMILWVSFDDIQEVCVPCHEIINLQQKYGISFEEASILKQVISLQKNKEDVAFIKSKGYNPASNAVKRKAQLIEILTKEKEDGRYTD